MEQRTQMRRSTKFSLGVVAPWRLGAFREAQQD
jgi:hypothetical protein